MDRMERHFSSGSRQAPDPFDRFLETHDFYRKHTARDPSCLFRAISEQMYDTQSHHLEIRKRCVRYMRKHSDFFRSYIERDIDDYLDELSKPKTYATLIELRAVGYMFQRTVILFQPYNLGDVYVDRYDYYNAIRVFYSHERHFDSVFTSDYVNDLAECQALCFEILYKDFFKLPDLSYAVERMLYPSTFDCADFHNEINDGGYCTAIHLSNGRSFLFDMPFATNCILENYELCHFHNWGLANVLQPERLTAVKPAEISCYCRSFGSVLPNKYMSCVRQLLQEGITPFPYKVAKALDFRMYRNIEFDAWNEARKAMRLHNWYHGDTNFKVGAKCHLKPRTSNGDPYTCHIQEVDEHNGGLCLVFIEQLGEKRLVPYEDLMPLPPEQFRPWALPYRMQRQMNKCSTIRLTRQYNYRFKFDRSFSTTQRGDCCSLPMSCQTTACYADTYDSDPRNDASNSYYQLHQFTHLENFHTQTLEYCAMPLTVHHAASKDVAVNTASDGDDPSVPENALPSTMPTPENNRNCSVHDLPGNATAPAAQVTSCHELTAQDELAMAQTSPDYRGYNPYSGMEVYGEEYYGTVVPVPSGGTFYYVYNQSVPAYQADGNNVYIQATQPPMQITTPSMIQAPNQQPCYTVPPPYYPTVPMYAPPVLPPQQQQARQSNTNRVNFDAKKSYKPNGNDLPHDIATLQHFYNLGIEYYQLQEGLDSNAISPVNQNDIANFTTDMRNLQLDNPTRPQEPLTSDDNNNTVSVSNHSTGNSQAAPMAAGPNSGQNSATDETPLSKPAKVPHYSYQRRNHRDRYNNKDPQFHRNSHSRGSYQNNNYMRDNGFRNFSNPGRPPLLSSVDLLRSAGNSAHQYPGNNTGGVVPVDNDMYMASSNTNRNRQVGCGALDMSSESSAVPVVVKPSLIVPVPVPQCNVYPARAPNSQGIPGNGNAPILPSSTYEQHHAIMSHHFNTSGMYPQAPIGPDYSLANRSYDGNVGYFGGCYPPSSVAPFFCANPATRFNHFNQPSPGSFHSPGYWSINPPPTATGHQANGNGRFGQPLVRPAPAETTTRGNGTQAAYSEDTSSTDTTEK